MELRADPNIGDPNGLHPLTFAVAHMHLEVANVLFESGVDARAAVCACEVLAMWAPDPATRRRAFKAVEHIDEEAFAFHKTAYTIARAEHEVKCAQLHAGHLDSSNADVRFSAVCGLAEHALAGLVHASKLAVCLADPDCRVRKATVEAFAAMGKSFDIDKAGITP